MHDLWQTTISRRTALRAAAAASVGGALGAFGPALDAPSARAETVRVLTLDIPTGPQEFATGLQEGVGITNERGRPGVKPVGGARRFTAPFIPSTLPFTHLGLHWEASDPEGVRFQVRTSIDGNRWTDWEDIAIEAGRDDVPSDETFGALVSADRATFLQYRARFDKDSPVLTAVTATLLNAVDGPRTTRAAGPGSLSFATSASAAPAIVSRESWGCDDSLRFRNGSEIWPRMYVPAKKAVVHHTATANGAADAAAEVRAIYTYHAQTLGWGDIGYNLLIGSDGRVFEGRRGRDLAGGREIGSLDAVAGHTAHHNYGAHGVALIGDFRTVTPSQAARTALLDVLAWVCDGRNLDPRAASDFLRWDDAWARGLANVCAHRNCVATECPGEALYALLPGLRASLHERLGSSAAPRIASLSGPNGTTVTSLPAAFSWTGADDATPASQLRYRYVLEGWRRVPGSEDIVYLNGFNADRTPAWPAGFAPPTSASFSGLQDGHYTLHVEAMDGGNATSVYEANATFLLKQAPAAAEVIVDNDGSGASFKGKWDRSTNVAGYYGTSYHTARRGNGADVFTWQPSLPASGTYDVFARWTAAFDRATNARYTVQHSGGNASAVVNQRQQGGQWVLLGRYAFAAGGAGRVTLNNNANGFVIADAVRFVPAG